MVDYQDTQIGFDLTPIETPTKPKLEIEPARWTIRVKASAGEPTASCSLA